MFITFVINIEESFFLICKTLIYLVFQQQLQNMQNISSFLYKNYYQKCETAINMISNFHKNIIIPNSHSA